MGTYEKVINELNEINERSIEIARISKELNYRINNNVYKPSVLSQFYRKLDLTERSNFFMELLDNNPELARNVLNRDYGRHDKFLTSTLIIKCVEILIRDNLGALKSIILRRGNENASIAEYVVNKHFDVFKSFNIKDLMTISLKYGNERVINLTCSSIKNATGSKLEKIDKDIFDDFLELLNKKQTEELNAVITLIKIN